MASKDDWTAIFTWKRQQERFLVTVILACKIFFGAFLWQGFGIADGSSITSISYYFSTGAGVGVGTMVGHLFTMYLTKYGRFHQRKELERSLIFGLACVFGPGTAWQPNVNFAKSCGWSYTATFFYIWLISGALFLTSMTFFKAIASMFHENFFASIHVLPLQIYLDFLLAISFGLGDAFFTGTSATLFSDDWLAGAFGVYDSTYPFVGMFYAGLSTMVGFLISQSLQNVLLNWTWTDETRNEHEYLDYYLSHRSERIPLGIQQSTNSETTDTPLTS